MCILFPPFLHPLPLHVEPSVSWVTSVSALHSVWALLLTSVVLLSPTACSVGGGGGQSPDPLHSLFLFPMHIPLSDVTLKRHRAWENGAAEVFRHVIILSAWQLTSLTHTHTPRVLASHHCKDDVAFIVLMLNHNSLIEVIMHLFFHLKCF